MLINITLHYITSFCWSFSALISISSSPVPSSQLVSTRSGTQTCVVFFQDIVWCNIFWNQTRFLSESDLRFCLEVVPHLHHDHLLLLLGLVVDLHLGLLVGGVRRGGGSEDAWRRRSQRGLGLSIGTWPPFALVALWAALVKETKTPFYMFKFLFLGLVVLDQC